MSEPTRTTNAALTSTASPQKKPLHESTGRAGCPACGGRLIEIRGKLQCSQCHQICETCCEGGCW